MYTFFLNLLLFSLVVYGLSWLITKAELFRLVRKFLLNFPIVGQVVHCIVCTAVWVGLAILFVAPYSTVLSQVALDWPPNKVDIVLYIGWIISSTWILASLLDDAD
jgi:hypothetical protein